MKRGGPQHPKVILLAAALGIERYAAVGLLECLWHWTAQYAPRGDLGRYDDATIAQAVGFADGSRLVKVLVACRLLDPHPTHRLVVHDWHDHADQAVQRVLSRRGEGFVSNEKGKRKASSRRLARELDMSSLARGNGLGSGSGKAEGEVQEGETPPASEFDRWYAAYPRKRKPEDARRAWAQTAGKRPPLATMLATLAAQRASPEWTRDGGQFVPHPATYLRAHSWADDVGPPSVGQRPPEDLTKIKVHPLAALKNAMGQREVARG